MSKKVKRRSYGRHTVRRKRRWWLIPAILGGLVLAGIVVNYVWFRDQTGQTMAHKMTARIVRAMASPDLIFAKGSGDRVNILVLGVDVNRDRRGQVTKELGRTDTIAVITLDRYFRMVRGINIPRDTRMDIPEWEGRKYGRQKVNAAHAYGGPDLVIKTLESNLCIPIHHYIRTNFEGLVGMVDEIGGVELYVEKDMDYDDNWGQLHIHLKQGWQVLDGDKAHQYSRFRHDREGDIGRIRRQQKLVEAIARKVLSTGMILKLPSLMEKAQEYITTDMRRRELMSLAMFLKEVNSDQIAMEMLPVYDDGPDLLPQREEAGELLQTLFGDSFKQDGWNSLAFPRRVREGGTTRPRPARKPPQPSAPASEATETKVGDEEASWPTAEVVEEGEVEQVPSGKSETGQGGEKETVSPGEGTDGTVSPDESVPPQEDSQSEEGTPPPPKVEPSPPDKVEPPPKRQPEIRGGESTEKPGLQKWVCTFA